MDLPGGCGHALCVAPDGRPVRITWRPGKRSGAVAGSTRSGVEV
jgi:hypothetical protein